MTEYLDRYPTMHEYAEGKRINPKLTDLISRADAIEAIQNAYCKPCKERGDDYNEIRCRACEYDSAIIQIDALPSSDAVHGYTEWLEKIIVDAETFEWLCEDTNDKEWCEDNCHYSSIQTECLRHLYKVSKGGDDE